MHSERLPDSFEWKSKFSTLRDKGIDALKKAAGAGATLLAIAVLFGSAIPAHSSSPSDTATPDEIAKIVGIATSGDSSALKELTPKQVGLYNELAQEDPSREVTVSSFYSADGEKLAPEEEARVREAIARSIDGISPAGIVGIAACYSHDQERYGSNSFGDVLYIYGLEIQWCMSGSTIRSTSILSTYGAPNWLGWSYSGLISRASKVIGNVGRSFAQYNFKYVPVGGGGAFQQALPCIRMAAQTATFVNVGSECRLVP